MSLEYQLISSDVYTNFVTAVNEALNSGWTCQGGVFILSLYRDIAGQYNSFTRLNSVTGHFTVGNNVSLAFYQAMVRQKIATT